MPVITVRPKLTSRVMKPLAVIVCCWCAASACAEAPPPPAENRTPVKVVSVIPRAAPQPRSDPGEAATLDLDAIVERGYIRVLVARSKTHFYTSEGAHSGKTVDTGVALAQVLSNRTGRTIRPVFIEAHEPDLIPNLLAGKGDVAANILLTFARDEQVAFAPPIRTGIRELVVTPENRPLVSLEDVGTRTIYVREGSDHHASLVRLNEQLRKIDRPPARIVLALPPISDEELMERVHNGQVPATIVDDYVFARMGTILPHVVANPEIAVSQDGSLAWITRKDATKLIAFLNEFFTTHKVDF
jgi:membrane-bound lytic murein transglycosylase MltF